MNSRHRNDDLHDQPAVRVRWEGTHRSTREVGVRRALIGVIVGCLALPATCFASLPDGRVYEQVSPANKNGNSAGVNLLNGEQNNRQPWYAFATANGNGILFGGDGPMGESVSSGIDHVFIARRNSSGWHTISAMPRDADNTAHILSSWPMMVDPSPDLTQLAFIAEQPFAPPPDAGIPARNQIFIANNSGPGLTLSWPGAPATPDTITENIAYPVLIGGAKQDFSTLYFMYQGTLLPEDASRAPNVGNGFGSGAWGLYEYTGGVLRNVGILPDGSLSPFGAAPAGIAGTGPRDNTLHPDVFFNEVADQGSRVVFVSPDPAAAPPEPSQLYVREGGQRTILISRDELLPSVGGFPAPAPDGPADVAGTYMYASPDGSRVFFASVDQLTTDAPPGSALKEYMFDLTTEMLEYVPAVHGSIVTSSNDGSRLLFENTAKSPMELAVWTIGSGGRTADGTVMPVAPLSNPEPFVIASARATAGGSIFVFTTTIAGFNNAGSDQIYRLDVAGNQLTCVSCPPIGVSEGGQPHLSNPDVAALGGSGAGVGEAETRGMSSDGNRIFFDTLAPLVPQDTNGRRDVYAWENGVLHLISSGKSPLDSFFLDSSDSGGDVFFTTAEGLVGADTDQTYDVYDARIPRPGDNPSPTAVLCQGDACQGPPGVPSLLGAPPSATFNGAGNLVPAEAKPTGIKRLTRAQRLARALKVCRAKRKKRRRTCEARARRTYRAAVKATQGNRRGK
jgi:hypothetical protein